jgi:cysteinyl-tRNA synthetase
VGAGPAARVPGGAAKAFVKEFNAALDDDLDTPRAIRVLRRAVREGNAPAVRWMLGILAGSASLT